MWGRFVLIAIRELPIGTLREETFEQIDIYTNQRSISTRRKRRRTEALYQQPY